MSFFYLTPVKGDMPTHLMELIIIQRLEYLKGILKDDPVVYNQYVVEGGAYDNVGHFMLCIVAILGNNSAFSQLFYMAEIELFKRRVTAMSAYDLRVFAKKLLRTIKKCECVQQYIYPLQMLCQHLMIKDLSQHICSIHSSDCTLYSIKINFRNCLTLIAKRLVELKNGLAVIPCGMWKQYLFTLYKESLKYKLNNTNLTSYRHDPRITHLIERIQIEFHVTTQSKTVVKSKGVDGLSMFFPPCMVNLHQSLRRRHRLSHTQRFHYSLFLKDIGMSIEEAIDFWKSEYHLEPNGSHSCCHSWEKDEKKFLYGIRHMYGLEGCKKNYTSVNCKRIQSTDNARTEGGCPFKFFDTPKMSATLTNCSDSLLTQINELQTKRLYTSACVLYLESTHSECINYSDNLSLNFTPVKYFMLAANIKSGCF